MSRWIAGRLRLHLKWATVSLVVGLAAFGLYRWGGRTGRVGGKTSAGRMLGYGNLLIIAFATSYMVKRRLGGDALKEGVARKDPGRAVRLVQLRDKVGSLQASHDSGEISAEKLRAAATAAVVESGFAESIGVAVAIKRTDRVQVGLHPRLHPGRRENSLMRHEYTGLLVLPLMWFHHPTEIKEPLGMVLVGLACGTVATGILGSFLYLVVPRLLLRLEASSQPSTLVPLLDVVMRRWVTVHLVVAVCFVLELVAHVLVKF